MGKIFHQMTKINWTNISSLQDTLQTIHWQFECTTVENLQLDKKLLFYGLLLDKHYIPMNDDKSMNRIKSWCTIAGCTAAYAYKTIGNYFSEPMRIWLANAANCTILYSLLAEIPIVQQSNIHRNSYPLPLVNVFNNPNEINITSIPDGNWRYGLWTRENLLTSNELKGILKPEMSEICLEVMIAGVINYFQEGCLMPKLLSKYANDLINTKAMNMYGITNDNDKLQIMAITSSWISKIHILHEVTIRCCLKSQLREVRTLGLTHIQLNIDMMKCFQSIPAGWNRTKVAVQIANKLIQSKCFYYMERLDELIRLGKLWQKVNEDPMTYHICGKYLTNNEKNMLLDDACNLFGRLITFLKYSEPKSELFTYKYLKSNDQTLERLYTDYSDKWEAIVKVFYCTDKLDPTGDYTDQLKNLQLIPNNFKPDENTIRLCRKLFIKIPENL